MSASKDHSYCVLPWAPCVWRGDGVHLKACRIFPDQGWSVCHLQWKHGVFNRWTAREGSVSLLLCVDPWVALAVCLYVVCLHGLFAAIQNLLYVSLQAAEQGRPPEHTSKFYAKGALQYLVPILTQTLTKQVSYPPNLVK